MSNKFMITKVCHFEEHSINNDLLINEDMKICKDNQEKYVYYQKIIIDNSYSDKTS